MSQGSRTRLVPLDLVAVACLTALSVAVLLGVDTGPPLAGPFDASPGAIAVRIVSVGLGLAFLLFLPGYAVVSVLFPGHEPAVEQLDQEGEPVAPRFQFRSREGIDALERVTLAVGVSAVITPVTALALNFTPWGIRVVPLVVALAGITLAAAFLAAFVRWRLPPEARFAPNLLPNASPLFSGSRGGFGAANTIFVVGLLVAVAGIGYAVAVPQSGEQFTELYLLSEDENGTLVADDYPEFVVGEPASVTAGVENHEDRSVEYTLVAELQQVERTDNGSVVRGEREIHRSDVSLADGETAQVEIELTPEAAEAESEGNLRLRVLLFRGPVPEDPSAASAYRSVDLQPTVAENETETEG